MLEKYKKLISSKKEKQFLSSGSYSIDEALGGGFLVGRIFELFGLESTGKTTVALHIIKEAQELDKKAIFVDVEKTLDLDYAENLGVDIDKLMVLEPENGEMAIGIILDCVKEGIDLVVCDTVASLCPRPEKSGEVGDSHVGLQARLMSQALRKITTESKGDTTIIFLNQIRENIGVKYGDPEVTPGGKALKFYSTGRIKIFASSMIKDSDENIIGRWSVAYVEKLKNSPPFRKAKFPIIFGDGVDKVLDLINLLNSWDALERKGAWFKINDLKFNGINKMHNAAKDDSSVFDLLVEKYRECIGS